MYGTNNLNILKRKINLEFVKTPITYSKIIKNGNEHKYPSENKFITSFREQGIDVSHASIIMDNYFIEDFNDEEIAECFLIIKMLHHDVNTTKKLYELFATYYCVESAASSQHSQTIKTYKCISNAISNTGDFSIISD
ncbi:hypothetical protein [Exiguobacterium sp. R-39]|uniref:hypothetical protein n=1 Tax=Exiguobacterium sp. R-39 TaxID=3416708 RepID=UPI003CED0E3C